MRRLPIILALLALVPQAAPAHEPQTTDNSYVSKDLVAGRIHVVDKKERWVGHILLLAHEDGLATGTGGTGTGPWFEAIVVGFFDPLLVVSSGPLDAGSVNIDPTAGGTVHFTVPGMGAANIRLTATGEPSTGVGFGVMGGIFGGDDAHTYSMSSSAYVIRNAVASGKLGRYELTAIDPHDPGRDPFLWLGVVGRTSMCTDCGPPGAAQPGVRRWVEYR